MISKIRKGAGYIVDLQRSIAFLNNTKQYLKNIFKNMLFSIASIKYQIPIKKSNERCLRHSRDNIKYYYIKELKEYIFLRS